MHDHRGGEDTCRAPEESSRGRGQVRREPRNCGHESSRRAACAHRCSARSRRGARRGRQCPGTRLLQRKRTLRGAGSRWGGPGGGMRACRRGGADSSGPARHSCGLGFGAAGPARNDSAKLSSSEAGRERGPDAAAPPRRDGKRIRMSRCRRACAVGWRSIPCALRESAPPARPAGRFFHRSVDWRMRISRSPWGARGAGSCRRRSAS